jgi:hypothetical protein
VRNRMEAGGADCPSVSSGLADPGESEIGGFWGGSTTVCEGCSLSAVLIFFFGALGDSFGIFSGAIKRGVSGALPGNPTPSSGKCAVSNHREMLAFRSSIAAHPDIPKLAERAIETSATRARVRIDLAIVGVREDAIRLRRRRHDHAPGLLAAQLQDRRERHACTLSGLGAGCERSDRRADRLPVRQPRRGGAARVPGE